MNGSARLGKSREELALDPNDSGLIIAASQAIQEELHKSRSRLSSLIETMGDAFFAVERDHNSTFCASRNAMKARAGCFPGSCRRPNPSASWPGSRRLSARFERNQQAVMFSGLTLASERKHVYLEVHACARLHL